MDPKLADLTILFCRLTGASQGIGERLAYEFSKYGAILSLSARKEDQLKKLCDSLNRSGGQAKYYPLDVNKIEQIEEAYKKVSLTSYFPGWINPSVIIIYQYNHIQQFVRRFSE